MRTLEEELKGQGYKLSPEQESKVKSTLDVIKKKYRKSTCKRCGEPITFQKEGGKVVPNDPSGSPHWQVCPYSLYAQKKAALPLLKKMSLFLLAHPSLEFDQIGFITREEFRIIQAILEKEFKRLETSETTGKILKEDGEEEVKKALVETEVIGGEKIASDVTFTPEPNDPIGDPDEERAPSEEEVEKAEPMFNGGASGSDF